MSGEADDRARPKPLATAVTELCADLQGQASLSTASGLREVSQRLSAPLQVAVAGRIKSGKSTLVNALIGRRVAPTDIGECTRLVTRFQYGTVDRVEVVFRDGTSRAVPFDADGGIPADLGVDFDSVSHLEAYLTNAVLRELTVIDTPGLGSTDDASVARTEQLLGVGELDDVSRAAVVGAEAIIYVVTQAVRADDQEAIESFTAATASRDAGPVNAIAVLNKADMITPQGDDDLWAAASRLALAQATQLKPKVADVLPAIGLLAETAEGGGFREADGDALKQLAALDQATRELLLVSADLFTSVECDVPSSTRQGLLERLDLYGIRRALDAIATDGQITAGALRRTLRDASGLPDVTARLNTLFRARADGIKAAAGLASVAALAQACDDLSERRRMYDGIEALLAKPEAHQLRVLEALTSVASGAVAMPEDLTAEVVRVGSAADIGERVGLPGRDTAELAEHALERAGWWRSFASFGATPAQSRIAHVVHRAYFLMWQELRRG